jgi:hypothetical protein
MRWIFKKQTTLRISTRVSQHPRNKTLLSKQTRTIRKKFWLRALVRKKKKTVKENMMKMKWLYSSRNSTSSSRRENLTREKRKRSQSQRGCTTIVVWMGTSLSNAIWEKEEDNDKRKKFDKCCKKYKKYTKKKHYGQAHVGQKWNSSDESSESESDEVATIAIKGKTSSSKSLFTKLSKHTCLMEKEGRKRWNPIPITLPSMSLVIKILFLVIIMILVMIITLFQVNKNPKAMIKGLMRQEGARDELLEQQEELLVQERKISEELKKLLALKKVRWKSLIKNLLKIRRLLVVSRAQLVLFKVNIMS